MDQWAYLPGPIWDVDAAWNHVGVAHVSLLRSDLPVIVFGLSNAVLVWLVQITCEPPYMKLGVIDNPHMGSLWILQSVDLLGINWPLISLLATFQ